MREYLRRFLHEDWKDLHEYLSNERVVRYEPYDVFSEEECKKEAEKRSENDAFWAVCLKSSDKLIGNVYFKQREPPEELTWEIGFVFNPDYQGSGYALESCTAVMNYGFDRLNVHTVAASCDPDNIPTWKLLERLNLRRLGCSRKSEIIQNDENSKPLRNDSYEYEILKDEWKEYSRGDHLG